MALSLKALRPTASAARDLAAACFRGASTGRSEGSSSPLHTGGIRDDPGHELGTGGLYESARKDREVLPSPVPGVITQETADQVTDTAAPVESRTPLDSPEAAYPVHQDPAASLQHPTEAFRSPAEGATGAAERAQSALADRAVEGPVPPSSNVEARADVHGVTRGSAPEDVQRGKVGITKPSSRDDVREAHRSFAEQSVGQGVEEPTRGKLDDKGDWERTDSPWST